MLGIACALAVVLAGCVQMNVAERGDGFVALAEAVPDVILEPRYYSTYNFVGERIDGYEDGFKPLAEEWWHFTLANEPYPDTYFDFPVIQRHE